MATKTNLDPSLGDLMDDHQGIYDREDGRKMGKDKKDKNLLFPSELNSPLGIEFAP